MPEIAIAQRIMSLKNPRVFWMRSPSLLAVPCTRKQNVKQRKATKRVLYRDGVIDSECMTSGLSLRVLKGKNHYRRLTFAKNHAVRSGGSLGRCVRRQNNYILEDGHGY